MIILGTNSIKETGYDVANSCRFNSGDSAVLKRTHGTPTNAKKFVWSAWIKRSKLGADQYFVNNFVDSSNLSMAYFRSGDDIRIFDRHGTGDGTDTVWISDAKFRDTSAWMHFLLKVDTTQSTDSDRFQVYINGSLATGNGITYPALNADMNWTAASASNRHSIAATSDGYNYVGGYLCEVVLVDGTSPAHTDFGEFDSDSGIWKPIDVSGLTFGNNGYYLDFADSGDLGDDESGNGNDFAETNLAATDQSTDTCTNNFMTFSPLYGTAGKTFSEGNLKYSYANNYQRAAFGSITPELGKWYFEFKNDSNKVEIAVCNNVIGTDGRWGTDTSGNATYRLQNSNNAVTWVTSSSEGRMSQNGSNSRTDLARVADGEIGMYAFDLATGKIWTGKGGNWDNSGNPATGANPSATWSTNFTANTPTWFAFGKEGGFVVEVNFGSPPYAISSSNTDGDGHGNFEYAVPSGYFSLCTKNLAEYG